jgi:hypothetical protein
VRHKKVVLGCMLFLVLCLFPLSISAATPASGTITMEAAGKDVKDGYFYAEMEPGQSGSITVQLKNSSNQYAASAVLYFTDAIVATGGGMGAVDPKYCVQKQVGGWFSFQNKTINLNPSEVQVLNIPFTIPKDATEGEHIGEIILYKYVPSTQAPKKLGEKESQIIINKAYSQIIGIEIKTPGPAVHKLTLDSMTPKWTGSNLYLNLEIGNAGNMIEKSDGTITISQNDRTLYTQKGNMGPVYPDTSGDYCIPLTDALQKSGTYQGSVEWHYDSQTVKKDFTYTIKSADVNNAKKIKKAAQGTPVPVDGIIFTPLEIILICAGILIVFATVIIVILKKKRKSDK